MGTLVHDITREKIEDFLYEEAALLDEWRLQEWLDLLTEDATYEVPSTDTPEGDARTTLFIIADNIERIRSRVNQLLGKAAWAENPPSRTRRLISNVRILATDGETVRVAANFIVYRMRVEQVDTYVGRYEYTLVRGDGALRIQRRRAIHHLDRKSTRLNSSHGYISYAVFCLKKKKIYVQDSGVEEERPQLVALSL